MEDRHGRLHSQVYMDQPTIQHASPMYDQMNHQYKYPRRKPKSRSHKNAYHIHKLLHLENSHWKVKTPIGSLELSQEYIC
jgi:hypothetical protein